ncbi:hypothetical protein [Variovorax sp. PAMC 28711]|uniref:hypothetical protein n=1 Tax=Variovorax sp. PAMC 28711 TaxID=1795631 RepID=UPI00078E5FB7|nr:hypothetical protein [Variovorax sp. PAMC 28711]AMM24622.1 hypothetical protein AX767_09865 [Variovorax sp. PAMC 28711]
MTSRFLQGGWLLALALTAVCSLAQVKQPTTPRSWADALMTARDQGDANTVSALLSEGKPAGDRWSIDMVLDQFKVLARSAGKVEARRFVEEKTQAAGGSVLIYETTFSRSGRYEEQVVVQRRDGHIVIDGPISLPCNLVACFKK